jgi:hypothetical protein
MSEDKGTAAIMKDILPAATINTPHADHSDLHAQTTPIEPRLLPMEEKIANTQVALPKSTFTVKPKAQPLHPAAPMGTSSAIGSIKTVRPKRRSSSNGSKGAQSVRQVMNERQSPAVAVTTVSIVTRSDRGHQPGGAKGP